MNPRSKIENQESKTYAYTLIEVLTTVAVLVIILGLMVSLARHVRNVSAERLTRDLLLQLDELTARYQQAYDGRPPRVFAFIHPADEPDELTLDLAARQNNEEVLAALHDFAPHDELFEDLPITVYDGRTLRDAWGTPIVFMAGHHPAIGMAPGDRPFFFSAGPDRRFLTRRDNLYSYER